MDQNLAILPNHQERRLARRSFLVKISLMAGTIAIGTTVGESTPTLAASNSTKITSLYRLISSKTGDHFYTTSSTEKDHAISKYSYKYEGVACHVCTQQGGESLPVYRLNNSTVSDHFYTTNAAEKDRAISNNAYQLEGIAFYAFSKQVRGTVPMYRLIHPGVHDHFYTLNENEKDRAVQNNGYQYEGIAFYVLPPR